MSYTNTNLTNLGQLKKLATRTKAELDAVKQTLGNALQAATYSDNTLKLFRSTDTTGTPAFSFDLPEEMFLDQNKTEFVGSFAWSAAKYPGSTNPELDGNPVMVLAVKGDETNPSFSFLDMQALVDTYTANDDSVTVGSYKIAVKIDPTAGNALQLVAGKGLRVDISGKADKVASATSGDLAGLGADGNLTDSGVAAADVVTKIASPTADNLIAQDANGKIADSGIAKGDVQKKLAANAFTAGNVRTSDANGFAQDGGVALSSLVQGTIATDAEVDEMITEVFGA